MEIVRTKRHRKRPRSNKGERHRYRPPGSGDRLESSGGERIPGLGGIRKIRFGLGTKGKRGGGRAICFLVLADDIAVMLCAYANADRENLSADQKMAALALTAEFTSTGTE